MVTFLDHGLPAIAVLMLWFGSTALVLWLANRPRATYAQSLRLGAVAGVAGLAAIAVSAGSDSRLAAYVSFAGGLLIWGWHELAFLTGAVAGPRREPPADGLSGWRRFTQASATVIHHEAALALTAVLLLALTARGANAAGAEAFALLFALRLSAKLNLHVGVPNFSHELLPAHLGYLRGYMRRRAFGLPLAATLVGVGGLVTWLGVRAVDPAPAGAATAASLLFALGLLGAIEHLLLALPVRDSALWRWAMPADPR